MALMIEDDNEGKRENEAIDAAKVEGQAAYQEVSPTEEMKPDVVRKAKVPSRKPVDRARTAPKKVVQASPLAEPDEAYEGPTEQVSKMVEKDSKTTLDKLVKSNTDVASMEANIKKNANDYAGAALGGGALANAVRPTVNKAVQGLANKANQIRDKVIEKVDYALDWPARRAAKKAAEKAKVEATNLKWQKIDDNVSNAEGMRLVRKGVEESNAKRDLGPVSSIIQTRRQPANTVIKTNPARKVEVPAKTPKDVGRPPVTEATRIAAQTAAKKVAAKKYPDRPGNVIKHNR